MVDFRNIFNGARKKKLIVFSLALATTCVAFSVAKGNDESLDTLSSNSNPSTAEQKLTSEEIDKIIEDLKVSGNVDNIIDKLMYSFIFLIILTILSNNIITKLPKITTT